MIDAQMESSAKRPLPDLKLAIGNNLRTKNISHFATQNINLDPSLVDRSQNPPAPATV